MGRGEADGKRVKVGRRCGESGEQVRKGTWNPFHCRSYTCIKS